MSKPLHSFVFVALKCSLLAAQPNECLIFGPPNLYIGDQGPHCWHHLFQLWSHNLHKHITIWLELWNMVSDIVKTSLLFLVQRRGNNNKNLFGQLFQSYLQLFGLWPSLESSTVSELPLSFLTHHLDKRIHNRIMGSLLLYLNQPEKPSSFLSQKTMFIFILSLFQNCQELWRCWYFTQCAS